MSDIKYNNGIVNEMINEKVYTLLPETLQKLTQGFESRERDIVLTSTLGVISASIPKVFGIYDGDKTYSNLFCMIIAPAASGKGVMNKSRILIDKIHDKLLKSSLEEIEKCKNEKKKLKERNFDNCPTPEIKILPANTSTAEMYSYLASSEHGLLIMESEADTMSIMLKNDWSNYSDVLRKAFQHEPISISRKIENIFVDVKEPKLSVVLSGTPEQMKSLVKSKENGLFSRFIVYCFDEISGFKTDLFSNKTKNSNSVFIDESQNIYDLYGRLKKIDQEIEFVWTETQHRCFINEFVKLHEMIIEFHSNGFISNLRRHGLIMFRIAMILSVLRDINNIDKREMLVCRNVDFLLALNITKILLKHSLIIFNSLDDAFLSENDEQLLFSLKKEFTRAEAIKLGKEMNIPIRTIDDKISQWKRKRIIIPIKHGTYRRDKKLM